MKSLTSSCFICALNLYFAKRSIKGCRAQFYVRIDGELDCQGSASYVLIFLTAMFYILQLIVEGKVLNTDLEHNLLQSVVPVFVNVSDVDDNIPRFLRRSYQ